MVKAKPTRRRTASTIENDANLSSQLSHQPPRDPPINHVEPLHERVTDDADPLRDAPSKPLSHVQVYMLLRREPPNFDSVNGRTLQQYTYITEGYEKFLENGEEFDDKHSVLDRVLSSIVYLADRNVCLSTLRVYARSLAQAYRHWRKPVLWDPIDVHTFINNTLARDPQYYEQLHRAQRPKPQASPELVKTLADFLWIEDNARFRKRQMPLSVHIITMLLMETGQHPHQLLSRPMAVSQDSREDILFQLCKMREIKWRVNASTFIFIH